MQKVLGALLIMMLCSFILPYSDSKDKINWISFEETEKRMKEKPLPILIDVYTDWCGWCKVMDKKTYANDNVAAYINQHFYAVKFNAESRDPIQWKGKTYTFQPQYKMHGLAIELLKGEAGFPTTVFIPVDPSDPQPVPGFLQPKDMHTLLTYFAEEHFKKVPYNKYAEKFKSDW
jgi:uncharacterized protein YyaL (SSP411 family)